MVRVRVRVRVALLIQLEGRLYIDIKNAIYAAYRPTVIAFDCFDYVCRSIRSIVYTIFRNFSDTEITWISQ